MRVDSILLREAHWAIADLLGKAGLIRTVSIPGWVKKAIDDWKQAGGIRKGALFRSINKAGRVSEYARETTFFRTDRNIWSSKERSGSLIGPLQNARQC